MEHALNMDGEFSSQIIDSHNPSYQELEAAREARRNRSRRWLRERIEKERRRLAIFMVMAHGAVHLSLRSERNPRVREAVGKKLQQQYGLKSSAWWQY